MTDVSDSHAKKMATTILTKKVRIGICYNYAYSHITNHIMSTIKDKARSTVKASVATCKSIAWIAGKKSKVKKIQLWALSRFSPRVKVKVGVSIVLGLTTRDYSWIWPNFVRSFSSSLCSVHVLGLVLINYGNHY